MCVYVETKALKLSGGVNDCLNKNKNKQLTGQDSSFRNLKRKLSEKKCSREKIVKQKQLRDHCGSHMGGLCGPVTSSSQTTASKTHTQLCNTARRLKTSDHEVSAPSDKYKDPGVMMDKVKRMKGAEHYQKSKGFKTEGTGKVDDRAVVRFTPELLTHYKKVQKRVSKINSLQDFELFFKLEKKRKIKSSQTASCLLTENEWNTLTKLMRSRVRKAKKVSCQASTTDDTSQVQQILPKMKFRLKLWLLFPHLKGKKPENWKNLLNDIRENK